MPGAPSSGMLRASLSRARERGVAWAAGPAGFPSTRSFLVELKSNIALPALRVAVRQSRRHVEGARILRLWIKHLGETIQPSWFDPGA